MEHNFWELHKRLGECYAAQMQQMKTESQSPTWASLKPCSHAEFGDLVAAERRSVSAAAGQVDSRVTQKAQPKPESPAGPCAPPVSELNLLCLSHDVSMRRGSGPFVDDLRAAGENADLIRKSEGPEMSMKPREFWQTTCAQLRVLQHPGSRFRAWWGTVGALLLCYDLVAIPLRESGLGGTSMFATTVMSWISQLYWNFDLLLSFIAGYYDAGVLILDLRKTAKSYASSWFVFDLAVVSIDWIIVALNTRDDGKGVARLSKTVRALRFLRLARLGRTMKAGSMIESLREQFTSRMASLHYGVAKIILRLMLINHIIACFWYMLSTEEEGPNWVKGSGLEDESLAYLYATSLHWTFSQFGAGQTAVEAVTLPERVFSVVVAFFCLIMFSTLVSSVSSMMANLQRMKDEEIEQFQSLRRFLAHNNIDADLSHRITRFLEHTCAAKNEVMSADERIPMLSLLSTPLQAELQLQRHKDCLGKCAFFHSLLQHDSFHVVRAMRNVALNCMSHAVHASGDVIFVGGTLASSCFFPASGSHSYTNAISTREVRNAWVAEMCLWTPWVHVGVLVAKDSSRLISMEVTSFCECVGKVVETRQMASAYATQYVAALNAQSFWSDLADEEPLSEEQAEKRTGRSGGCCPWRLVQFGKVIPSDGSD
ncbi:unnamed protein product [Effrenium voratum]|uniref:Ion transport domain-containing protein n=1 Tax=Effrenium voratum TaxID=2562239 RepID=A0AA36HVY7_9DINO|nr:unnamed protein product [Effrenium voratum]CAJ1431830.1 unnamed protein product [Effrenium voratum]